MSFLTSGSESEAGRISAVGPGKLGRLICGETAFMIKKKPDGMKIVLGSTSEDKKEILKKALADLGVKAEINGVEVSSGVPDQPLDEKTTIKGATNRDLNALKFNLEATLAFGLEGGLRKVEEDYFLVCVTVIGNRQKRIYLGVSSKLRLPKEVSREIEKGEAFGVVIRDYAQKHRQDKKLSRVTDQLIHRKELFGEAIRNAYLVYQEKRHYD